MDAEHVQLEKDQSRQGDGHWLSGKRKTKSKEGRWELEIRLHQREGPLGE